MIQPEDNPDAISAIEIHDDALEYAQDYFEKASEDLGLQARLVAHRRGDRYVLPSHIKEALALIETKRKPDRRRDAALTFGSAVWGVSATELLFQTDQHTENVVAVVVLALALVIATAAITWGLFKD